MLATLKAEFRKLLTVRSTYIISSLALLIVLFMSFYVEGYKGAGASTLGGRNAITDLVSNITPLVSLFASLVVILLMAHEYRHNTITYTLTASNSRTKVLLSKIIVAVTYASVFVLLCCGIGVVAYLAGIAVAPHGLSLVPQEFNYPYMLSRIAFYAGALALFALLFTTLIRHLVAAVVIIFIGRNTIEPLLGLVLKDNVMYLPFSALSRVLISSNGVLGSKMLAPGKAMVVVLAYLVVGWAIAGWLFVRRDAN